MAHKMKEAKDEEKKLKELTGNHISDSLENSHVAF